MELEKLRNSLLSDRDHIKRSALKSTATKSNMSFYTNTRERELSPVNKSRVIINLGDSISDNKVLEEKRVSLSTRFDFCLTELFSLMDYGRTGLLSLADLKRFSYENGCGLVQEDLCILIDRFDKDRDGLLTFGEFSDIFLPSCNPEYRRTMQERPSRNIYSFAEYTTLTQTYIKDLMRCTVNAEENFECNKFK